MDRGRAYLVVESILLLVLVAASAGVYKWVSGKVSAGPGFQCDGHSYRLGPGRLSAKYLYSDALCGVANLEVPVSIDLQPSTLCASNGGPLMAYTAGGKPVLGGYHKAYAVTPMGVRPAYEYSLQGGVRASACVPVSVPGRVVAYYDRDTGLLLKAETYTTVNGSSYMLRELALKDYSVEGGANVYRPSPLLGIAYAGLGGVAGAALALLARRLIELF